MPTAALPEVVPSYGVVGTHRPAAFLGLDLPIAGIAGDQQAALFGQACFASRLEQVHLRHRLVRARQHRRPTGRARDTACSPRSAWRTPTAGSTYALEGAVFVTGAAVQWLRDGLQIIGSRGRDRGARRDACPTPAAWSSSPRSPGSARRDWDPHARGTIIGITRGTTRAHLVRATLEAIAFEVRDVVDLMVREGGVRVPAARRRRRRRPTTCSASCRPTRCGVPVDRAASRSRPPGSARRSSPARHRRLASTDDLMRTRRSSGIVRARADRRGRTTLAGSVRAAGAGPSSRVEASWASRTVERESAGDLAVAPQARAADAPTRKAGRGRPSSGTIERESAGRGPGR